MNRVGDTTCGEVLLLLSERNLELPAASTMGWQEQLARVREAKPKGLVVLVVDTPCQPPVAGAR